MPLVRKLQSILTRQNRGNDRAWSPGLQLRFRDAENLVARIEWAVAHPEKMARMHGESRAENLAKYTPERNYELLMELYGRVTAGKKRQKTGSRTRKL